MHSFSVGLPGAPDTKFAKKVAEHIGSQHHEIEFTVQEALDAIPDVIYHLETFDVTTIRAGTPMYLMSRTIKSMGIKMILSGEGADEIFGGYLYFHKAPEPDRVPRGARAQDLDAPPLRLPARQQGHVRPGASRPACPSSTRSSSTSRWASTPRTR